MKRRAPGPGLAKAKTLPVVQRRAFDLVHTSDYRIREMFENADVMSEGAIRTERSGLVYYGTTSVLLTTTSVGGLIPDHLKEELVTLLRGNPHARVRAIRIACREAQVRTRSPIGRLNAEVIVHTDARGVRFDVDVEAPVLEAGKKLGRTS